MFEIVDRSKLDPCRPPYGFAVVCYDMPHGIRKVSFVCVVVALCFPGVPVEYMVGKSAVFRVRRCPEVC